MAAAEESALENLNAARAEASSLQSIVEEQRATISELQATKKGMRCCKIKVHGEHEARVDFPFGLAMNMTLAKAPFSLRWQKKTCTVSLNVVVGNRRHRVSARFSAKLCTGWLALT